MRIILTVSRRLIAKNRRAQEELAKGENLIKKQILALHSARNRFPEEEQRRGTHEL